MSREIPETVEISFKNLTTRMTGLAKMIPPRIEEAFVLIIRREDFPEIGAYIDLPEDSIIEWNLAIRFAEGPGEAAERNEMEEDVVTLREFLEGLVWDWDLPAEDAGEPGEPVAERRLDGSEFHLHGITSVPPEDEGPGGHEQGVATDSSL